MIAVIAIFGTLAVMAGLLWFTETLDRRRAIYVVRRVANRNGSPELAEQLVAEECERLLRNSA